MDRFQEVIKLLSGLHGEVFSTVKCPLLLITASCDKNGVSQKVTIKVLEFTKLSGQKLFLKTNKIHHLIPLLKVEHVEMYVPIKEKIPKI